MLGILRRQLETGYANRNDVALQEAALAQVAATLPPLRKALQQNRDLLSALAGVYPSEEPREIFKLEDLHLPVDLPVSLPSQLIEQRPDIRAAQEHVALGKRADRRRHRQSAAEFHYQRQYRLYEYGAGRFARSPESCSGCIAGNAAQTLFDGGTLLHQLQGAKDTYNAAAWSYRGTVIGAVQNVTDSLRALQNDADALKAARDFERAAKISFDLARQQMQTGNANVLILLTAQQTYLQAVIQVVQARAARLSDTVALYQALGGGWWNRIEPPPEKTLNVGTGQAETVTGKDKKEGFLRGFWFLPFQPD